MSHFNTYLSHTACTKQVSVSHEGGFFLGSLVTHGRRSVASSFRLVASDPFQFSTYSHILTLYNLSANSAYSHILTLYNLSANSAIQQSTNEYMLAVCGTIVSLVLN